MREHGDSGVDKVDRGAATLRLFAYSGARAAKVGGIGDVYTDLKCAVGVLSQRQCVIKILGGFRVYSKHWPLAHVLTFFKLLFNYVVVAGGYVGGLFLYLVGEGCAKPVLHHNRVHLNAVLARFAYCLYEFAGSDFAVPAQEFDQDFSAVGKRARNLDWLREARIVGHGAASLNRADKLHLGALDYLFNAAAGAGSNSQELDLHLVAV